MLYPHRLNKGRCCPSLVALLSRNVEFLLLLAWCLMVILSSKGPVKAEEISFSRDVMAVLSRSGCNLGVCHGNQHGKGGFKLSLRGQDPQTDWKTLTRGQFSRRVNFQDPEASLILQKPTLQVAHQGGQRFRPGSQEYQILRQWIAVGARNDQAEVAPLQRLEVQPAEQFVVDPQHTLQLSVTATFADGSQREVTSLAVFEPNNPLASVTPTGLVHRKGFGEVTVVVRYLGGQVPVRIAWVPKRPHYRWREPATDHPIDRPIATKLQALRIRPAAVCDDVTFLRRVYLDLHGALPPAEIARQFVANPSADKRTELVERLLEDPAFADYWSLKWSDLLRNEEKVLDRKGVQNFHAWIRRALLQNQPLDVLVRDLLRGRGSTYTQPAANYYRANRDPLTRAETTAQLFLGTRLQCAKCHNHPFERWTQQDYYRWASIFSQVDTKILENRRRDKNDKHEFNGEQIVYLRTWEGSSAKHLTNPATGRPSPPQLLGAKTPLLATAAHAAKDQNETQGEPLDALARWVTNPNNQLFVRSQVNRIWYHLMGRGIVEPIDDFRSTNPPVNEALLRALCREFRESRFDIRHLIKLITSSRAYQRESIPPSGPAGDRLASDGSASDGSASDGSNFSYALLQRVPAEPLLDAVHDVCGVPTKFAGYPRGLRAVQLPGVQAIRTRERRDTLDDRFLKAFGKPPRLLVCECERSEDATLAQIFHLVSGPLLHDLLSHPQNRLTQLLSQNLSDADLVHQLYWSTLSRGPSSAELATALGLLETADQPNQPSDSATRREVCEDLLWGLINSKEFLFRR